MVFEWKAGAQVPVDPQKAGTRLHQLEQRHGAVTPQLVVADATNRRSPLHQAFEWDDTVAAKAHRLNQARYLLRSIVVKHERSPEGADPIRAYVRIANEDEDPAYISIDVAMSSQATRDQLVTRAFRELEVWRQRYEGLRELAEIFAAIEAFRPEPKGRKKKR